MKTYKKIYIGKGKSVEGLQIIKISFNMTAVQELTHEYKGETYLSFEVAKMKQPDQFGNDFTVYVNKLEEAAVPATSSVNEPSQKVKKTRKTRNSSAAPVPPEELPF